MTSAHYNEDNNPCKMLSDAFHVTRNSPSVDEVPILQTQAFCAINPRFLIMYTERRTYVCA